MLAAYAPTSVYFYEGGLTTPTCDEVVNWFVVADVIQIPQAQLDDFEAEADSVDLTLSAAREVQALNDREVYHVEIGCTDPNWTSAGKLWFVSATFLALFAMMKNI